MVSAYCVYFCIVATGISGGGDGGVGSGVCGWVGVDGCASMCGSYIGGCSPFP